MSGTRVSYHDEQQPLETWPHMLRDATSLAS
jgi:hypothetical protein